jgi:hypothetical protein
VYSRTRFDSQPTFAKDIVIGGDHSNILRHPEEQTPELLVCGRACRAVNVVTGYRWLGVDRLNSTHFEGYSQADESHGIKPVPAALLFQIGEILFWCSVFFSVPDAPLLRDALDEVSARDSVNLRLRGRGARRLEELHPILKSLHRQIL